MGVVTDRRRVWRCFYHLPFLWLFNLNFQHVCSKLHSLQQYIIILFYLWFHSVILFLPLPFLYIFFSLFNSFLLCQTLLAFTFSSLFRILHVSNLNIYFLCTEYYT